MRYESKPLRDPAHLGAVFSAKQHRRIMLQMSSVEKLPQSHQQGLLEVSARISHEDMAHVTAEMERVGPLKALWRRATEGYLRLPVPPLCDGRFTMEELAGLQQIVDDYRDLRIGEGATATEHRCECAGQVPGCRQCGGKGIVIVLDEMTSDEREMASQ